MADEEQTLWISGFWRRIAALLLDSILFVMVGLLIGTIFEAILIKDDGWGFLIGFSICLVYFGIMNSSVCNGQTFGKQALGIRVVDENNNSISLARSLLRSLILLIPFYFDKLPLTPEFMTSYMLYPLAFFAFGGLLVITYLYIFNRKTRQSLHDLVTGTYVVYTSTEKQPTEPVWKVHYAVAFLIVLACTIYPVTVPQLAAEESELIREVKSAQSKIMQDPDVIAAGIFSGYTTTKGLNEAEKTVTHVTGTIRIDNKNVEDLHLASQIARIIITEHPEALEKDVIQITLSYGYDIGIFKRASKYTHRINPKEVQLIN